jgi:hypothetical protein
MGALPAQQGEDLVLLPVPKQHYESMVRTLGELIALASGARSPDPTRTPAYPDVPWSEADIRRLKQEVRNATVLALLVMTAKDPGRRISFEALSKKVGRTHDQTRADMAGFSQLVHRRFKRRNWPIEWEWGAGGDQQAFYYMVPETAPLWKSASTAGRA